MHLTAQKIAVLPPDCAEPRFPWREPRVFLAAQLLLALQILQVLVPPVSAVSRLFGLALSFWQLL